MSTTLTITLTSDTTVDALCDALESAWSELQWHSESCEDEDHCPKADADLALLADLSSAIGHPDAILNNA